MKQEKRQKKYQDEMKAKRMKSSDTPLMAAEKMREAQARNQTPYLVLSGNAKTRYADAHITLLTSVDGTQLS
jgi:U4/U6.U5 tri-snRNP-associated protein 1